MYVLFEDNGKFKAEKIFSEAESSLQVESATGKRSKIRRNTVYFEFSSPEPQALLDEAERLATEFDIQFLWDCAPQEEFTVQDFGTDYFGRAPTAVETAALIFALQAHPAYFHRRGRGIYRPAPPDILEAALAAIERRRQQEAQQAQWTEAMLAGELPPEIAAQADSLLSSPDKNSMEWKAFEAALSASGLNAEQLLLKLNAWSSPLALHRHRFLSRYFPRGIELPPINLEGQYEADFPDANVQAYSIDDAGTVEIDDALSFTEIDEHRIRVGIHIAVPGLAVQRDNDFDQVARKRLSTVYTPGQKIPMLPAEFVEHFSLVAGQSRPALSLYVEADRETGDILHYETRLERLTVTANLIQSELEPLVTLAALENEDHNLPHGEWLRPLWRFSRQLSAQREAVRGKPEHNNRVEYSFELEGAPDDPNSIVQLIPRVRNAPLGLLTAEFMILANNLWGGWLAEQGLPGIYRSQQAMRTRMSTHPAPHDSIGVPQYAWSTSPLRRYVDLVNQWQLIAAAQHGVSARLVAPFKPKDADLYAIISAFEAQYTAWGDFQHTIERYWCLRWLQQHGIQRLYARVIRDDLVRFEDCPLVVRVGGMGELPRDQRVHLEIMGIDELALEVDCRLLEVCDADPTADSDAGSFAEGAEVITEASAQDDTETLTEQQADPEPADFSVSSSAS